MTDDESIDPSELDTHTFKQIKRIVEAYPVVSEDPSKITDYSKYPTNTIGRSNFELLEQGLDAGPSLEEGPCGDSSPL